MKNNKTRFLTTTALMTAVLCILGPLTIPIGPVPISLANFAICIIAYILDTKRTVISVCLYILLGLVGLPVFSGFGSGVGKLFGPTGGYIIGYIPMAIIVALFVGKFYKKHIACIVVMEASTWLLYLIGTVWLAYSMGMTFSAALAAGVIPFIIEDFIKMVVAAFLGPVLRKRLSKFTSLEEA